MIIILILTLVGWLVLLYGISIFIICLLSKHLEKLLCNQSKQFWIAGYLKMWITTKELDILMIYFGDLCHSQLFLAKKTDLKGWFTKEASKLREFPIAPVTFHIVLMKPKSAWFQLYFNGFCWHMESQW